MFPGSSSNNTLHQIHVLVSRARAKVTPSMLPVESQSSQIGRTHAQSYHGDTVFLAERDNVSVEEGSSARTSHLWYQIEKVHVAYSRFFEDLHFHLPDDSIVAPHMDVPIRKSRTALLQSFEIVDTLGASFIEKAVLSEATNEGVSTELNANLSISV